MDMPARGACRREQTRPFSLAQECAMSWPPFRCVVDSHPPAVYVCRSARGRPHLRRTPVSFRPASRISTKHAGRRRGKRVSAVFCVSLSPGGRGRSPRGSSAPLRPSRASRVGGADLLEIKLDSNRLNQQHGNTRAPCHHDGWRYCLPRRQRTLPRPQLENGSQRVGCLSACSRSCCWTVVA